METNSKDAARLNAESSLDATNENASIAEEVKEIKAPDPQNEGNEDALAAPAAELKDKYYKTSLCSFFRKGACKQKECRYAHGDEELKIRPDGTWDPTSDTAKKLLEGLKRKLSKVGKGYGPLAVDERLKICIHGFPFRWRSENVEGHLKSVGISCVAIKKRPGHLNAFLTFTSTAETNAAEEALSGSTLNGRTLSVSDVVRPPQEGKPPTANQDSALDSDADEDVEDEVSVKEVWQAVTPLANIDYEEQLSFKQDKIAQNLRQFVHKTRKCSQPKSLPKWVMAARQNKGLPCEYLDILPSPLTTGYRNKCEFSVGLSTNGAKTVGFQLGTFKEGVTAVEEPKGCLNVSEIAMAFCSLFQKVVEKSPLPPWDKKSNTGFWRMFTVREGRSAASSDKAETTIEELMLIMQVCTKGLERSEVEREYQVATAELIEAAKSAERPLPLTVILAQEHNGISNSAAPDCPLVPLFPSPDSLDQERTAEEGGLSLDLQSLSIHDHLGPLKFRISPTAFFQVNTLGAERLYSVAGDWAALNQNTILFDVCCGTGTIGLSLAHRVAMVVGIELNAAAVKDAFVNADINGISNCDFVAAKAEDVMSSLLAKYSNLTLREVRGLLEAKKEERCAESQLLKRQRTDSMAEKGEAEKGSSSEPLEAAMAADSSEDTKCEIVAIVDPPRSGLHPTVLRTLRTSTALKRLVYVSCNAETLVANALELCTPIPQEKPARLAGGGHGWGSGKPGISQTKHRLQAMPPSPPFLPVKAMAVDMFPHTNHCEVVVLFER